MLTKNKIDVFSLFNVLFEYVEKDCFSILAVTDVIIGDPDIPKETIFGRACGDRVAVISCFDELSNRRLSFREVALTGIHELLHTLGLDHCVLWKCIMNAYCSSQDADDEVLLCPLDMKKIWSCLNFDVKERYL